MRSLEIIKTVKLLMVAEDELRKMFREEKDLTIKYNVLIPNARKIKELQIELLSQLSVFWALFC